MTTSVSDIANVPREVVIGKRTLKLRQLSLKELFGFFEQKIKSQKIIEAKEVANLLEGNDKKEFLIDVWKNLPTGTELTELATDLIGSADGVYDVLYLASKDLNDMGDGEGDIRDSLGFSDLQELTPVINWIIGMESKESDDNDNDNENEDEKKNQL